MWVKIHIKVAGAGYYNKILFKTKHGNVCDVSVSLLKLDNIAVSITENRHSAA